MSTNTSIAVHVVQMANGHKIPSPRAFIPPVHSLYGPGVLRHTVFRRSFQPLSTLPPSLSPPAAAGAPSGPSPSRSRIIRRGNGCVGCRRVGHRRWWYGTRGLDNKPLGCLLFLPAPRVHCLDEQATNRARCDEEEPLGDARDDVVDLG